MFFKWALVYWSEVCFYFKRHVRCMLWLLESMTDLETGIKSIVCNGAIWFGLQSSRLHWLALLDDMLLQTGGEERSLWNYSLVNWKSKHLSTQEETCGPRSCRYSWSWGSGDSFKGSLHRLWPWKEADAVHTGMREPAVSKDTPMVSLCKGEAVRRNSHSRFLCMHVHVHIQTVISSWDLPMRQLLKQL